MLTIVCFLIVDAKRLIGRKFNDASVQSDMKHWPFTVINQASKPMIKVEYKGEEKTFSAEEVSSMVLNKMKETAEAYLGKVCISHIYFTNKFEFFIFENFILKFKNGCTFTFWTDRSHRMAIFLIFFLYPNLEKVYVSNLIKYVVLSLCRQLTMPSSQSQLISMIPSDRLPRTLVLSQD